MGSCRGSVADRICHRPKFSGDTSPGISKNERFQSIQESTQKSISIRRLTGRFFWIPVFNIHMLKTGRPDVAGREFFIVSMGAKGLKFAMRPDIVFGDQTMFDFFDILSKPIVMAGSMEVFTGCEYVCRR